MAKRHKKHEHVNHERWLVSYADFITLLFAFFTTMYAISTVDAQKMGKMVSSVKSSFDGTVFPDGKPTLSLSTGPGSGESSGKELIRNVKAGRGSESGGVGKGGGLAGVFGVGGDKGEVRSMGRLQNMVDTALVRDVIRGRVSTRIESRGLVVSLGESGVFSSGSDQISAEGLTMLDGLATSLAGVANQIRVEGHTDTVPIHVDRFPSNWELSTARATAVVAYLVRKFGYTPERLSASGYGEFRPIAPNDTVEGRAKNRRVDIVVLDPRYALAEPK